MRGRTFFALSIAAGLAVASAEISDKQIKEAQANVDNESAVVYGGTVGKLDVIVVLELGDDVYGYYYYPTRDKNKRYTLRGTNPKEGVLLLDEFTENDGSAVQTATCRLTKRVTDSRIIWEGTMNNTDGRSFSMHFSRPK